MATKRHRFDDAKIPNGVAWSPDGTCLLTSVEDSLHLFEFEASFEKATLVYRDGERVHDYAWYPGMHSSSPQTCCFASCSRDHPIHLWDAYDGTLRASYVAKTVADDLFSAVSLAFSPDGSRIYAGMNRSIRVFMTSEPGAESDDLLQGTTRKTCELQGLVGALDASGPNLLAAGSYSRIAAVYDTRTSSPQALLNEKGMGGVTAIKFDENELWTGCRKDDYLRRWDLRQRRVVNRLARSCATNQKIAFQVEPFVTGSDRGLCFYDEDEFVLSPSDFAVNGCSTHPFLPFLATSSGQRSYDSDESLLNDPSNFAIEVRPWPPSRNDDDDDNDKASSNSSSVAY